MVLKKKMKVGKFTDKQIDSQTDDEPQMIRKGLLKELKIKRGLQYHSGWMKSYIYLFYLKKSMYWINRAKLRSG